VPARSRWRKTQTSFGPVGRLVLTALLLAPMWFFWQTGVFGWQGMIVWGLFVLPWGLRETWQRTRLRHAD
jgi:hypothetical protein